MKYDPAVISIGLFVGAIALYSAAVTPMSKALTKMRAQLVNASSRLDTIEMDIRLRKDTEKRVAELERQMNAARGEWISPMLDSYPMRAKAFLDTMAREAGLVSVEYSEGSFRALPVPNNRLPETRTGRHTVRLRAHGDYAAVASFILRAEAELPYMTVQALKIQQTQSGSPDRQELDLLLEWPCEGKVIK